MNSARIQLHGCSAWAINRLVRQEPGLHTQEKYPPALGDVKLNYAIFAQHER